MLDPRLIQNDLPAVVAGLGRRGGDAAAAHTLAERAQRRREAIGVTEALRRQQGEASAAMGRARASGNAGAGPTREALLTLKNQLKAAEAGLLLAEEELQAHLLEVPNLPHASVPDGADAAANQEVRRWGEPGTFAFAPRPHWELGEALGLLDFAQAGKVSGARFVYTLGDGARLERALATYMLELARQHGYREVAPPLLVHPDAMQGAGQFPKFRGEAFAMRDDPLVLIPTAEVPLVGLHRDQIVEASALPLRYCAQTPCFRREAGAAGRDTRGLIRLHQFTKVELVSMVAPEDSGAELERITGHAEAVLEGLRLPYRRMALCAGDLGFAACKTYDLEVWLPSQNTYREISSCSNCGDFQARRSALRYRPARPAGASKAPKPQLLHTLNGSALAVGRTLVAVLENYQRQDGRIDVPEVLQPLLGAAVLGDAPAP